MMCCVITVSVYVSWYNSLHVHMNFVYIAWQFSNFHVGVT